MGKLEILMESLVTRKRIENNHINLRNKKIKCYWRRTTTRNRRFKKIVKRFIIIKWLRLIKILIQLVRVAIYGDWVNKFEIKRQLACSRKIKLIVRYIIVR